MLLGVVIKISAYIEILHCSKKTKTAVLIMFNLDKHCNRLAFHKSYILKRLPRRACVKSELFCLRYKITNRGNMRLDWMEDDIFIGVNLCFHHIAKVTLGSHCKNKFITS